MNLNSHMLELCAGRHSHRCRPGRFDYCEKGGITKENDLLSDSGRDEALAAAKRPGTHVMVSLPCNEDFCRSYKDQNNAETEMQIQRERKRFTKLLRAADSICEEATTT